MIPLTAVFERYHGRLLLHARNYTQEPTVAEDLVSAAWERVVRYWPRYVDRGADAADSEGRMWAWLRTILHHAMIDVWRQRVVLVSLTVVVDGEEMDARWSALQTTDDTLPRLEAQERLAEVRRQLALLPESQRRVVVMAVERWGTQAHMSDTERVALHRARRRLREAI